MSEHKIDRWNRYKERLDNARTPIIRAFLHLVRPTEGFPKYTVAQIRQAYDDWAAEERAFNAATADSYGSFQRDRVFPEQPAEGAPAACWRMWAISIQFQVEGDHTTGYNLPGAVEAILATPECASHPASCPCRVPVNPWTFHQHVKALDPLGIKHNKDCECGGYRVCAKKPTLEQLRAEWRSVPELKKTAHVKDCMCSPCFWAREKAGGGAIDKLCGAFEKAGASIVAAKAMPGGDTDVGFAKNLFQTVQGVKFDDKCPHGLPFYACMPCSH